MSGRPIGTLGAKTVTARLDQLRGIRNGWLDGCSPAPQSPGFDWLVQRFESHYPGVLPPPYFYPTAAGGVQAEWSLGPYEITLCIDLNARTGEWHSVNTRTSTDDWRVLDLGEPESWAVIAAQIQGMQS